MKLNKEYLIEIKGDASQRKFYRKFNKSKKSIVIYSNIEKKKIYSYMTQLIKF